MKYANCAAEFERDIMAITSHEAIRNSYKFVLTDLEELPKFIKDSTLHTVFFVGSGVDWKNPFLSFYQKSTQGRSVLPKNMIFVMDHGSQCFVEGIKDNEGFDIF